MTSGVLHRRPKTVMTERLLDAAGRRCSPATTPRCHVARRRGTSGCGVSTPVNASATSTRSGSKRAHGPEHDHANPLTPLATTASQKGDVDRRGHVQMQQLRSRRRIAEDHGPRRKAAGSRRSHVPTMIDYGVLRHRGSRLARRAGMWANPRHALAQDEQQASRAPQDRARLGS